MLYRALLLLALATAHAWNDCAFPDVGYFVAEEGIGYSSGYAGAAMNGKMYMGGHTKGHLALLGITDDGVVTPEPSATLWGDVGSDVQVRLASPSTVPPGALVSALAASIDRASTSRRWIRLRRRMARGLPAK